MRIDCAQRPFYIYNCTSKKKKNPWRVWAFAFASISSVRFQKMALLEWSEPSRRGLGEATNKRSAECKHIVRYSFMQHTLLSYCSVVCLSCVCVLQFSTPHRNNDSSSCVWLYNYQEARAYYFQRICGGVILCTVMKYTVYKTSEAFH